MDGVQHGRSSLLLDLLRIGLFSALLIGTQPALLLSSIAADQDIVPPDEAAMSARSTLFLYRSCRSSSADRVSWCEGYLLGLADILLALGNSRMAGGICKAEYDAAILNRIFSSWAEDHPDRWNGDMAVSAQASFREVWPCP
jgi:hypothetical protein